MEKRKHILYSKIVTSNETPKLVKWIIETKIIRSEILTAYLLVIVAVFFATLSILITKNTLDRGQNSAASYLENTTPSGALFGEKADFSQ